MRLRKALTGTLAGLAGAAVVNRALTARAGPLPPAFDADHHAMRWRGFDISYAVGGDADDQDILLLHGLHAAASNHEWRNVFDDLAEDYHVVAPDLPGFGHSDRPAVSYSATLYHEFVRDFIEEELDDPIVLTSSLSGAYAAIAAEQTDVERLVLVCPTASTGIRRPWLRSLIRSPLVGRSLFNLLVTRPSLRYFNRRDAYYWPDAVDDDLLEYQWRTSHQPNARYAPASFVGGYLDPRVDLGKELAERDCDVTLIWGRDAIVSPLQEGRDLADTADARLVVIDQTRLLPHDEQPDSFLTAVEQELPRYEHE